NEKALENVNNNYGKEDIETISKRFNENLAEWLEILKNIEELSEF
ncbi:8714_t:CDS:1, partial [Funneliformis mosseae]